jgi:hypothetical protein
VLHEFLPAKQILHKRHIERIPHCDICGALEESIRHVLLERSVAKIFWETTKASTGVKLPKLYGASWVHDILHGKAALILCGMWSLWMQRNKQRHGEE